VRLIHPHAPTATIHPIHHPPPPPQPAVPFLWVSYSCPCSLNSADGEGASGQHRQKRLLGVLGAVQWALMAGHIFWDNMFFCTHPIVVRC
jgi:hypothetical protein